MDLMGIRRRKKGEKRRKKEEEGGTSRSIINGTHVGVISGKKRKREDTGRKGKGKRLTIAYLDSLHDSQNCGKRGEERKKLRKGKKEKRETKPSLSASEFLFEGLFCMKGGGGGKGRFIKKEGKKEKDPPIYLRQIIWH